MSELSAPILHLLCGILPTLLTWYFQEKPVCLPGKKIVDEPAYELLLSCSGRDYAAFNAALVSLYNRYDFRAAVIRQKLEGFENVFHKAELENIKNQIEGVRYRLDDIRNQIARQYTELEKLTTQEAGLIEKIRRGDASDGGLRDLFLSYPNLHLKDVSGPSIQFVVTTTINNYDPEIFEHNIGNENSFWYRTESGNRYSRDWEDEDIERFFKACFLDEILKIKVCAAYSLDFATGRYTGLRHFDYGPEFADYMPNQHIEQYSCIGGGHEQMLFEAMQNRNYIGAVNVCVASAGNMSMQEYATGEHHMKYLLSNTPGKCVILPDGSEVTPKEALAWLKENDKEDAA